MAYMRKSKFRHVFGKPLKRDQCYDALRISKTSWDSTFCAVSPKFVAVMAETSGGGFYVLPLSKVGRVDMDQPMVCGHTKPVLDIAWCPHNDNMIASGGEDCTVKVWEVPDEGLKEPLVHPLVDLVVHERRVTTVMWHPTAENVLLSTGSDFRVIIWDLESGEPMSELVMPEQLFCLSFNEDGSRFACTCKDKKMRVIDSHSMEVTHEIQCHDGSKPSQVAFLKNNKVITTGFSRMSERQYALWNVNAGSQASNVLKEDIDSSNGVQFIFNDNDTGMFYLAGKGDSLIRYYEVTEEAPYVHFLSLFQSNSPQRGIGYMPKRGLNVNHNEIARFYKLHNNGLCEVIPFTVPRKSELFQDDLYPDTASDVPAITATEFFKGNNAMPNLMSLKTGFTSTKKESLSAIRKSNLLEKRASKVSSTQSSNNAEAVVATVLPPGFDPASLLDDMRKLKLIVKAHERRIQTLENSLKQCESDEENVEDV